MAMARQHSGGKLLQANTNDSDLLAYSCPRVLLKMDESGYGKEIRMEDVLRCSTPNLVGFKPEMLLEVGP